MKPNKYHRIPNGFMHTQSQAWRLEQRANHKYVYAKMAYLMKYNHHSSVSADDPNQLNAYEARRRSMIQ